MFAFIGGGNMASALIGGLVSAGRPPTDILVVEPSDEQRSKLRVSTGVVAAPAADERLALATTVVWAVKPQVFAQAAAPCAAHVSQALNVSVMAGVRANAIAAATGSARVVRAMPNTPALIGQGIAGLYALPAVDGPARAEVESLFAPTGQILWLDDETQLDAVTALSGSGPAYVFYFLEAMERAASEMGLTPSQGRQLALATFAGATALAQQSPLPPATLRAQVTSPAGTTQAAIEALDAGGVQAAFVRALHAARDRARQLGT